MKNIPVNKQRILVLDGDHKNTLAIVRHLGRTKKYLIDVVAHRSKSVALFSRYVYKKVLLANPKEEPERYYNELLDLLKQHDYLTLIPVSFKSFQICSAHREEINRYTHLAIAKEQDILLASSKTETYRYAASVGVRVPRTEYPEHIDEVEKLEVTFPCVIKAPYEMGSNVVEYAADREELLRKYRELCDQYDFSRSLPIIQQYIKGGGFGFFAFYQSGKCINYFMHKRLREYPVSGGASTAAESYADPDLMEYGKRLLDSLDWEGVAMVEFKQDEATGLYYLMEINAKFWGSLDLALVCGVNFPEMMVKESLGKKIEAVHYKTGTRFQWLLNGDLFHMLERPRDISACLRDLFRAKNDIWLRDIMPNLFQLVYIPIHYFKKMSR